MKKAIFLFIGIFMCFNLTFANNVIVSNVSLVGQNTTSQFTMVKFDVSWENSWRTSTFESNWDAVWVFAKYRLKWSTDWNHAY